MSLWSDIGNGEASGSSRIWDSHLFARQILHMAHLKKRAVRKHPGFLSFIQGDPTSTFINNVTFLQKKHLPSCGECRYSRDFTQHFLPDFNLDMWKIWLVKDLAKNYVHEINDPILASEIISGSLFLLYTRKWSHGDVLAQPVPPRSGSGSGSRCLLWPVSKVRVGSFRNFEMRIVEDFRAW